MSGSGSVSRVRWPAIPVCSSSTSRCRRSTLTHARPCARELRELLESFGLPTLLVTHDYEDAAALAGRIGVLVDGRLLQIGTPAELIAAPADPFVASFTGGNLLRGEATLGAGGLTIVRLEDGTELASADEVYGAVGVIVYPWDVSLSRTPIAGSALNHVTRAVTSIVPVGNRVRVRVGPLTAELTAHSAEQLAFERGDEVHATFKATATRLVPLS